MPAGKGERGYEDLFDDEDDDQVMDEGCSDANSPAKKAAIGVHADEEDDDDFVIPATGRVKNRGAILDDENSLGECLVHKHDTSCFRRYRRLGSPNRTRRVVS